MSSDYVEEFQKTHLGYTLSIILQRIIDIETSFDFTTIEDTYIIRYSNLVLSLAEFTLSIYNITDYSINENELRRRRKRKNSEDDILVIKKLYNELDKKYKDSDSDIMEIYFLARELKKHLFIKLKPLLIRINTLDLGGE